MWSEFTHSQVTTKKNIRDELEFVKFKYIFNVCRPVCIEISVALLPTYKQYKLLFIVKAITPIKSRF